MDVASVHRQDRYNVNLESSLQNHHCGFTSTEIRCSAQGAPRMQPGLKQSVAPGLREAVSNWKITDLFLRFLLVYSVFFVGKNSVD